VEGINVVDMGPLSQFATGHAAKSPTARQRRCPRYPQELRRNCQVVAMIAVRTVAMIRTGVSPMTPAPTDAVIDEIISTCNGDLRGALKALLLVNEQLETELQQLYAASGRAGITRSGNAVLH
jgi:hypothetical protein